MVFVMSEFMMLVVFVISVVFMMLLVHVMSEVSIIVVVHVMSEVFMILAGVCGVLKFVVSTMFGMHTVFVMLARTVTMLTD